jgi:anti-repressor protein
MKYMNELIKPQVDENGEMKISGRNLHTFLGIGRDFTNWMKQMIGYGFSEHTDYEVYAKNGENPNGGRPSVDYAMTIDMAKEICMIQRTEKGKQARQYYIQLEKDWNSPEKVMARALKIANDTLDITRLELAQSKQIINELKPKADYVDTILQNKGLVTISQIAKDYGMSGRAMNEKLHSLKIQYKQSGQWLLYSEYQTGGYTHSQTVPITRSNGVADVRMETKWTQKGRLFLYNILKENGVFPLIEQ